MRVPYLRILKVRRSRVFSRPHIKTTGFQRPVVFIFSESISLLVVSVGLFVRYTTRMKSFLVILLVLAIIIGGGLYWFQGRNQLRQEGLEPVRSAEVGDEELPTVMASGVVLSVDREAIAYDGPAYVTIDATDGSRVVVAVPSMGLNLCAAHEAILDVYTLTPGVKVEVRGALGEDGYVTPCQSAEHYLRITTE